MKIIYQSYNCCNQNASGGVQNRLRKVASLVAERGFNTELFNPFQTKLEKGDVLHVFMVSIDNYSLIQYAKNKGVKIVISTIIPLIDEAKLRLYKAINKLPIVTTYKLNRMSLTSADALITESSKESDFICRYYQTTREKCHVIPNGTDFNTNSSNIIYDILGFKRKYILQVGRFDANKNQLNVIKALKNSEYDLVLVGGPGDQKYFDKCKGEAEGCCNIHFVGWLKSNSEELRSAYSNAEVVILPSFYETFGLVAVEGAGSGAKLILSKTLPINEFEVFENCPQIDPHDINDIREKVANSFNSCIDDGFTQNVQSFFSWDRIIDRHIEIYNSI